MLNVLATELRKRVLICARPASKRKCFMFAENLAALKLF